jgi:hypothetical protein
MGGREAREDGRLGRTGGLEDGRLEAWEGQADTTAPAREEPAQASQIGLALSAGGGTPPCCCCPRVRPKGQQ